MKINSEKLFDYINNLATMEKVKFNVYYDDMYLTEIYWDGENFNWEPGKLLSGAFFNPLYDFEIIEEDKEIDILPMIYSGDCQDEIMRNRYKINELVKEINKLKKGE